MVAILSGTLLLDLFYAMSVSRLVLHGGETCIFGFCSCTWHLTHSSYQPPRSTLQLSGWPTPWKHAFIKTTFWKRLVAQHGNLAPMMALREARAQKGRVPEPEVGPPKNPCWAVVTKTGRLARRCLSCPCLSITILATNVFCLPRCVNCLSGADVRVSLWVCSILALHDYHPGSWLPKISISKITTLW